MSSPTPHPPPEPTEGVVSWNINTACNYRCSYCTQRFKDDRGRWSRDTPRFLDAFGRLPGAWEFKLSGGEPFVHPTFIEIVEGITRLGHRVSVVTNFSAKEDRIAAFVRASAGRAAVVSLSLHLEYVDDVAAFARRASDLDRALADAASDARKRVCVTTVATRASIPRLRALADVFASEHVPFKIQPEKQDGFVVDYTEEERALLLALGGHNDTGEIEHAFAGRACWAGRYYLIVDDRGEAYRCYPARRGVLTLRKRPLASLHTGHVPGERELRRGYLGNLLEPTFRLLEGALPCAYARCYCTVPIARHMMGPSTAPSTSEESVNSP